MASKRKKRTQRGSARSQNTDWAARNKRAKRAGFRNEYERQKIRRSKDFRQIQAEVESSDPEADLSAYGGLERTIAGSIRDHRRGVDPRSSDHFAELEAAIAEAGLPYYMVWRVWYSETGGHR